MCHLLHVSKASVYTYKPKENKIDPQTDLIKNIFIENKQAYGTRRIKAECARKDG